MKKENLEAKNIIDNSHERELVKVLKDQLKKSKEAKFAIGYFFLSGFSLVKNDFPKNYENSPFLRIVMGNETTYPTKEELVEGYNLREIFKQKMIEDLQKREFTEEQISQLKTLKDFIANKIIDVRLFDKSRLHAKLYLFLTNPEEKYGSPGLAIVGSSNFTAEGITKNKELNILLTSREEVLYLNDWFDELWNESVDFREDLIKVIDISGVLPESPYPKVGSLIDPLTLFKYLVYNWFEGRVLNLLKKDILMEFQLVGVVNSVEKLNFYNGVILADSVGLGKSFIASAIIEEFINKKHPSWLYNDKIPSVMLILPPSIISQWEELLFNSGYFFNKNIKKNKENSHNHKIYEIYDKEKLIGEIALISLGLFQNFEEKELIKIAYKYDLFVIDEAHRYRNSNTNRWKNVRKLQKKKEGFPNKFLLLTATPLNNSINDIFNLIRLFVDDTYAPFRVKSIPIDELMKEYKELKKEIQKKDDKQIIKKLKEVATKIKQKILDEIMVLRTRKYIMDQFKDIKVNGKPIIFKEPKPYSLDYSSFYTDKYKKVIKTISDNINNILFEYTKLYGISFVVFEEESIDNKKTIKRLIEIADLFKLLLGKRLESSIYSFEITLRRVYEKEKIFYESLKDIEKISDRDRLKYIIESALEKAKINRDFDEVSEEYNIESEDEETWFDRVEKILLEYAEEFKEKDKKYKYVELIKLGLKKVLKNLKNDLNNMEKIFSELDNIKEKKKEKFKTLGYIPKKNDDILDFSIYSYSHHDPKLESLKQIIGLPNFKTEKLQNIPSLYEKKIVIFTQYKDTAYYLYHNLNEWIKHENDLHTWLKDKNDRIKISLVTGDTEIATKVNYIKRFAPQANNGFEEVEKSGEIDILISTDALSEGVNLQDADAVINYDLPWNPMIIVQRVGRVNRIGNDKDINVINYTPSKEIEIIVGVLKKLKEKIQDITLIVGKDMKILSSDEEINIQTFGEKIKKLSGLSITELEQIVTSDDFRDIIPKGIPKEQIDEYKLLNFIQYELGYTNKDFEDIKKMDKGPYYSYINGDDRIISVYEFYRGKYKIMKKIMSIGKDGEIKDETPLAFLDLIKNRKKTPQKIERAVESLKIIKEETEKIIEELKKGYKPEQKGFLYNLLNALFIEGRKNTIDRTKFNNVMIVLQNIPFYHYSSQIKELLINKAQIEISRNDNIEIKDFIGIIENLYKFFDEKGLINTIDSLKIKVKHVGWYYEI